MTARAYIEQFLSEGPWRLSAEMRQLLGLLAPPSTESLRVAIAQDLVELAEMFREECAQALNANVPDVAALAEWSLHHFNRELPPALRGMLLAEIRRPRALEPRREPPPAPVHGPAMRAYFEERARRRGSSIGDAVLDSALAHVELPPSVQHAGEVARETAEAVLDVEDPFE